jgi:hypothetical protein
MSHENTTSEMSEADAYDEAPANTPPAHIDPPVEVTSEDVPDPDQVLAFTHAHRSRVIEQLTKSGVPINDKEQMTALLKTLDGMDKQSLGRKRMDADKEIAKGTNDTNTALLAAVLRSIPNVPRPENGATVTIVREVPVLPADIVVDTLVDGQTEKTPPQDTYQSFMARTTQASQ